jgi:FtsP/CotA-like multicopper oxidase with cupredoxin domain
MSGNEKTRGLSRRDLLKLGGRGAAIAGAGAMLSAAAKFGPDLFGSDARASNRPAHFGQSAEPIAPAAADVQLRLAATDGFIKLPGRDPLYAFGFLPVPFGAPVDDLDIYKGAVKNPAPIIWVDQDSDVYIKLTNLGLVMRPDLDDSHTIHWHGFRNQISIFDGVPEVSTAVPVARDFSYFFRPREEGTYMYHCHFEDTEHVQMGMTGVVFVRPRQNAGGPVPPGMYAYNDGDGTTAYDREFALLLGEIDPRPHDLLLAVQEFVWSDYDPSYWVINARCYPDTVKPSAGEPGADPDLASQPVSSLIQANMGDRVLLRFVNLGYQQHAMQLSGIPMTVIGEDATYLGSLPSGRADISYTTNVIYIGPGESRDVLFSAPAHSGGSGPDVYFLRTRNLDHLTNPGVAGLGGMATEVRVYPPATLPVQSVPNETYAV